MQPLVEPTVAEYVERARKERDLHVGLQWVFCGSGDAPAVIDRLDPLPQRPAGQF